MHPANFGNQRNVNTMKNVSWNTGFMLYLNSGFTQNDDSTQNEDLSFTLVLFDGENEHVGFSVLLNYRWNSREKKERAKIAPKADQPARHAGDLAIHSTINNESKTHNTLIF